MDKGVSSFIFSFLFFSFRFFSDKMDKGAWELDGGGEGFCT